MRVLAVDDDPKLRRFVKQGLEERGHTCVTAGDAEEALRTLENQGPGAFDVVLLDVLMPGELDGYGLCEAIRARRQDVPIIFVTARHVLDDRLRGLRLGADDYLGKPFAFAELLARLEAVERRHLRLPTLRHGGLSLDLADQAVHWNGRRIELSKREFDLVRALVEARGAACTRKDLLEQVWGLQFNPGTNVVDVHVANLRRKLGGSTDAPIETVKGLGYRLAEEQK